MSEFSDRPFVAGSITGLRSFRVDSLGRLTGVSQRALFLPGENVAECRKQDSIGFMHAGGLTSSLSYGYVGSSYDDIMRMYLGRPAPIRAVEPKPVVEKKHKTAGLDCQCGYYAYFDGGDNPYHDSTDCISALIEGYGIVTVGTRGFRAERADLVALVLGEKARRRLGHLADRVGHNYPDVPVYAKKSEALAAHPVTIPDPLTPESCEDFWTRAAR